MIRAGAVVEAILESVFCGGGMILLGRHATWMRVGRDSLAVIVRLIQVRRHVMLRAYPRAMTGSKCGCFT